MSESKRIPKQMKPKFIRFITGRLRCLRDGLEWNVVDLNPERKVVPCPVCGQMNDIKEAQVKLGDKVAYLNLSAVQIET